MTAIGNPAAALRLCINTMTPANNSEETAAIAAAALALRGQPVPAASLETAACLWEAVLEMESFNVSDVAGNDPSIYARQQARAAEIKATREAIGSSHLRLIVLGWVDAADEAWKEADTEGGKFPSGGQYDEAFDWVFIPDWIVRNIDWSDAERGPVIRDKYDGLAADLHRWLVLDMGMEAETVGGGSIILRHNGPCGSHVLVTCIDGGGMPTRDSWHVGAYLPDGEGEAIMQVRSDHEGMAGASFEMAVAAACGMLADYNGPPPVPAATGATEDINPAALIADGAALLDAVNDVSCDSANRCFIYLADGTTLRVNVEVVTN